MGNPLLLDHDLRCPLAAAERDDLHEECLCGDIAVLDRHHAPDGWHG